MNKTSRNCLHPVVLINPQRTCVAGVITVLSLSVSMCVCVSVCLLPC